MSRYEQKLVGRACDLAALRALLRTLPIVLRTAFPPRVVQSVYFDTLSGAAVQDNLAGIGERSKLRVRWYGADASVVAATFEDKQRHNALGDKVSIALPTPLRVRGERPAAFLAAVAAGLPPTVHRRLDGHGPAQWIRYRREYLATADGSLRITLDRDLEAFDQRTNLRLGDRWPTPLPPLLIVEAKADAAHRDALERLLQHLPLRPSKMSKFVMASQPCERPTPSAASD